MVALVALAACGGDDDAATSTAPTTTRPTTTRPTTTRPTTESPTTTIPASTMPTTTSPTTTTAPTVTTIDEGGCAPAPVFDPSGSIRDQFVDHLVGCGFTADEAGCLFDHIKFDDPDVAAGDPEAMVPAFEACAIDPSRVVEIGGQ